MRATGTGMRSAGAEATEAVESTRWAMGTVVTQQAFGAHAGEALVAGDAEIVRLEALLSRFRPTSEISEIGRRAARGAVHVSGETWQVLARSREYAETSGGLFDPTVGPLAAVWQAAKAASQAPDPSAIEQALSLVDHGDLELDPPERTVGLRRAGQSLDLGGIGKGFATDRVLQAYRDCGVSSAFVNLGGNVSTLGTKPDGSPWRVGIRHPRRENELLGLVLAQDQSVVTSGDYERWFADRTGCHYHHILDPKTGYPADSDLSSVTVVAENATDADALSTIVFVAGLERGIDLLRAYQGVEAVLVDEASRVHITPGLEDSFLPADSVDVFVAYRGEAP